MTEGGSVRRSFSVIRPGTLAAETHHRAVPIETAIAFEINGIGYAVMMATPTDLDDFAIGFCLSEGLVNAAADIVSIDAHPAEKGWIVRIQLPADSAQTVFERARQRVSESNCGLCGMDNLDQVMRPLSPVTAQIDVGHEAIFAALAVLREHQPLNATTGAVHAAAFCSREGAIIMVREDVGRHNALDKLLGGIARAGLSPSEGFLLLSARCSFELVQKAVRANAPLLVTISAATSLAAEQAQTYGLRLISLARSDSALLLDHRLRQSSPT
jgi:FdhD protein